MKLKRNMLFMALASATLMVSAGAYAQAAEEATDAAATTETAAQRDTLAMLGCTHFQGYLHAAPLPEALCLAHLIEHGARGTLVAAAAPSQPAATVAACT